MTLATTSTKAVAQGNGATTSWPYTFLIPALDAVIVTLVDIASGNPTTIPPANFSITGLGNPIGGAVTYPLSGSPLASTSQIVIERFVPETQETDFTLQGAVYPTDIEDALDYVTMICQQLQDQVDRSIVFSVADTVETTLPVASARAGLFLGFDGNGAPIAVDGLTAGTTVSAAMIPVVTAPTTADALVALGLPGSLLDLLIPSGTCWEYDAGGAAPTGFVFPIGQACTSTYPNYRAKLVAAGSPYGTNGVDPLMPDRRSTVGAGKSNMGGVDNGLLTGGTVLGAVLGAQANNKTILTANLPAYTPSGTIAGTATGNAGRLPVTDSGGISSSNAAGGTLGQFTTVGAVAREALVVSTTFTGAAQGGSSTAISIATVQPTFICNFILKVH